MVRLNNVKIISWDEPICTRDGFLLIMRFPLLRVQGRIKRNAIAAQQRRIKPEN